MIERLHFDTSDHGMGETVEAFQGRNQVVLTLSSDWAGDTETGFGEHVTHHLTKSQVELLYGWLGEALDNWIAA